MGYATAEQLALVRAAAEAIIADQAGRYEREYVQRARATAACLDWIEGRREGAPSTGKPRRVTEEARGGLNQEIGEAEDLLRAAQRDPKRPDAWAEFYWHDTVWGVLSWYRAPQKYGNPPITVPGVSTAYE